MSTRLVQVMDFAERLRDLMTERCVSGYELARQVPCNRSYISLLTQGKRRPSSRMAQRIDEILGAGGELATLARHSRPQSGRREPQSADGPEPWELADVITRSGVSTTTLDFMERAVIGYATSYPFTPPRILAPAVQAMLWRMKEILGNSQPVKVRVRCVRLAGILCGVAGQLADDLGCYSQASGYFDAGALAGADIGDGDLVAWMLAVRSIGLFFRGEYTTAAAVLVHAEGAAVSSAERRRAWLAALSARARAALCSQSPAREASRAVMADLDRAYAQMDLVTGPPRDTEFFDLPRLAGIAGTTLLLIRDTRRAKELLGHALEQRSPADVKGRALLTLDLAECLAIEGEPEQAARLGADALDMVDGDLVRPVLARTQVVGKALRPWKDSVAVRDLDVRLAEIGAAGIGG